MGMDRNTLIGFALIGVLMIGMFYFNSKGNQAYLAEKKRIEDSIAATLPKVNPAKQIQDSLAAASQRQKTAAAAFKNSLETKEQVTTIETNLLTVQFSNKGAQPVEIALKNYKTFDGKPVQLLKGTTNKISYTINSGTNQTAQTADLLFEPAIVSKQVDGSQQVLFSLKDTTGKEIIHEYTLHPSDYQIDLKIKVNGSDQLIGTRSLNLQWQHQAERAEKDITFERQQTHLCYLNNEEYDFETMGTKDGTFKSEIPVKWLAVKQQFFFSAIEFTGKPASDVESNWLLPDTAKHIVASTNTLAKVPFSSANNHAEIPLKLFYGPSDFNVLKKYGNQMENIVPYGNGIFAFVKYINRYFLLPVFDFIRSHVTSLGIVVLLLTLFIRLLTSPILYKSYLSGAKMKALKPEIDALKAKFGDDQQGFGVEQMKLWRSAGVNPLGGCIPALLQIPIFMSLYYFFQANISLRGEHFLWATDLASYDSIYNLPFNMPLYGDHVSLFTLTATVTSLLISVYSMSNMQDQSNPLMKYMPYIFPIMLLGVFNGLPAALTWYYTVSNTITLLLQIVIQKYIINHDQILAQIEENKKKPVKQSKLAAKLQEMQENQKKMQESRNKGK